MPAGPTFTPVPTWHRLLCVPFSSPPFLSIPSPVRLSNLSTKRASSGKPALVSSPAALSSLGTLHPEPGPPRGVGPSLPSAGVTWVRRSQPSLSRHRTRIWGPVPSRPRAGVWACSVRPRAPGSTAGASGVADPETGPRGPVHTAGRPRGLASVFGSCHTAFPEVSCFKRCQRGRTRDK